MEDRTKIMLFDPKKEAEGYLSHFIPLLGNFELEICESLLGILAKATVYEPRLIIWDPDCIQQDNIFVQELLLKFPERADDVLAVSEISVGNRFEAVVVHPGQFTKGAVPMRAMDFLFGQSDQCVQMPQITVLQQRVA